MARMVEVNGQGAISVGLLELVDEPMQTDYSAANDRHAAGQALEAEVAALTELVAQQCELIGQLQPGASEFKRLQEIEDGFTSLQDRVSDMFLAMLGSSSPSREDCKNWPPELYALAEELANYGG